MGPWRLVRGSEAGSCPGGSFLSCVFVGFVDFINPSRHIRLTVPAEFSHQAMCVVGTSSKHARFPLATTEKRTSEGGSVWL